MSNYRIPPSFVAFFILAVGVFFTPRVEGQCHDSDGFANANAIYLQVKLSGDVLFSIQPVDHANTESAVGGAIKLKLKDGTLELPWRFIVLNSKSPPAYPLVEIKVSDVTRYGNVENWLMDVTLKKDSEDTVGKNLNPMAVLGPSELLTGGAPEVVSTVANKFIDGYVKPKSRDEKNLRRIMWGDFPIAKAYIKKTTMPFADEDDREAMSENVAVFRLPMRCYEQFKYRRFLLECKKIGVGWMSVNSQADGTATILKMDGKLEECLLLTLQQGQSLQGAEGDVGDVFFYLDDFFNGGRSGDAYEVFEGEEEEE